MDRYIPLAAWAYDGREQLRLFCRLDVEGIEPVEVADEDQASAEGKVGVGEVESGRRLCRRRRIARLDLGFVRGPVGSPSGAFGSKKPCGFGRLATNSMFRAACPASRSPGLSPTRGSFAVCSPCPSLPRHSSTAEQQNNLSTSDFISAAP
jgi:hypothetical protein